MPFDETFLVGDNYLDTPARYFVIWLNYTD